MVPPLLEEVAVSGQSESFQVVQWPGETLYIPEAYVLYEWSFCSDREGLALGQSNPAASSAGGAGTPAVPAFGLKVPCGRMPEIKDKLSAVVYDTLEAYPNLSGEHLFSQLVEARTD